MSLSSQSIFRVLFKPYGRIIGRYLPLDCLFLLQVIQVMFGLEQLGLVYFGELQCVENVGIFLKTFAALRRETSAAQAQKLVK